MPGAFDAESAVLARGELGANLDFVFCGVENNLRESRLYNLHSKNNCLRYISILSQVHVISATFTNQLHVFTTCSLSPSQCYVCLETL